MSNHTLKTEKDIFLVHGHNLRMKNAILNFLGKERTFILEREPYGDLLSLMEKFENIPKSVCCAVILFSDDDLGTSVSNSEFKLIKKLAGILHHLGDEEKEHTDALHAGRAPTLPLGHQMQADYEKIAQILDRIELRARQNVILELGYSWCKYERDHVIVIRNEGIDIKQIQSDLTGIYPILWDKSGNWKNDLSSKLSSIGIEIQLISPPNSNK